MLVVLCEKGIDRESRVHKQNVVNVNVKFRIIERKSLLTRGSLGLKWEGVIGS